ncbi:pre-toxin TG domain-containing protein, partial [Lysinibacillus sp. FJAT-14222]
KAAFETAFGFDPFTLDKLSAMDRGISAAGILGGGYAKAAGKGGKATLNLFSNSKNATNATEAAAKSSKNVASAKSDIPKGTGNNSSGRDVYGPYYDEAKKLHDTKPDWYPNPDESKIVKGKELKEARIDYQTLVRRGELEKGHHKQGLSFGGENVSSNIKKTGESTIRQKEIDELDLDFYHEMGYGKENAKILKIHENEKGIIVFGNNPQHTEVTVFQNKVLKWQKENGKR